jgi:hypothetical protein
MAGNNLFGNSIWSQEDRELAVFKPKEFEAGAQVMFDEEGLAATQPMMAGELVMEEDDSELSPPVLRRCNAYSPILGDFDAYMRNQRTCLPKEPQIANEPQFPECEDATVDLSFVDVDF